MKTLFYCILSLCMVQSTFAADALEVPGVDTSKGIGTTDVKYNQDGSMGVGDIKYDANGASAGSVGVDKNNARAGNLVASGGMNPELTPLKNAPVTGSATPASGTKTTVGGSAVPSPKTTTDAASEKLVVGDKLPQTGPQENLIIFIACILSAIVLYRGYKKNA